MERAVYTEEIATDITLPNPNMTIYRRYRDGVHTSYRLYPNEGYVVYDPNEDYYEENPFTGETELVRQYFTMVNFPLGYNLDNCPYIAVLRSTVNENDIYGDTDPDHEVM